MGARGKTTWSAPILPTPTQMFDGIQFHFEFGETTTTSCAFPSFFLRYSAAV